MTLFRKPLVVASVAFCGALAVVAAPPSATNAGSGNSYHFYTKALHVDGSGVVAVPSRFKWSVETRSSGVGVQGGNLPDAGIMLRLYDPDQNFTALTAQMDLATAARLHHELGELIVKKLENPAFEHRPQLYDPELIPKRRFMGLDESGQAIIELESPNHAPDQAK